MKPLANIESSLADRAIILYAIKA